MTDYLVVMGNRIVSKHTDLNEAIAVGKAEKAGKGKDKESHDGRHVRVIVPVGTLRVPEPGCLVSTTCRDQEQVWPTPEDEEPDSKEG